MSGGGGDRGGRGGLDWPGLMRVGMRPVAQGGLGLTPAQFWALTPAELALMLGIEAGSGMMTRARMAELLARYPDKAHPRATPCKDDQEEVADGR